ncbi:hypothetical protein TRIUR3_11151 [Triticum urartu]|uniref:Uncharacterized protein n=1 Tax=Triticum urartu TaxID=4572 RepID=M8AWK3_TRIUA|nr:hypothetical protein TRIUR3_11151 [Triticum urartu]
MDLSLLSPIPCTELALLLEPNAPAQQPVSCPSDLSSMYCGLTFASVIFNIIRFHRMMFFTPAEHSVLSRRRFPRSGQPEPIPQCVNDYVHCVILWDMTNPLPHQHIEIFEQRIAILELRWGYSLSFGSNNSLKLLFICKIHAIGKAINRIWHNERKIILLEIFVRS